MISKTQILGELIRLENLYKKAGMARENVMQQLYSKLATIECCGWIEQSMDYMACRAKKNVKTKKIIENYDDFIKSNYNFNYEAFSKIIMFSYGIKKFEKIETSVDPSKLDILKGTLGTLKKIRDGHAHTTVHGTITTFNAPSVTKQHFLKVFDGLKEFENQIKKIK